MDKPEVAEAIQRFVAEPVAAKPKFFPAATKTVGTDTPAKSITTIYGESGSGKSHLGYQLMNDPDYGPGEVLFVRREEASTIYGPGAKVVDADTFADLFQVIRDLRLAESKGLMLPKVLFIDSWSGLALGTQAHYRAHPIETMSKQTGMMVENKLASFGELGTQSIDRQLDLGKLSMDIIILCTTARPGGPSSPPVLALEGKMIPMFLSQLSTCSLYLQEEPREYPRETVEQLQSKGVLHQPHRIVCDYADADESVTIIGRFFYSQNVGEVIAKGHRTLKVKEPAYLPAILRKMKGILEPTFKKEGSK